MEKFLTLSTYAVALEADNIDTDQIMPKQFLRGIDKSGLDKGLFYNLKHRPDGTLDPMCVLNSPTGQKASLLLAGPNFGCGSSREHAVWGLMQAGFKVVASTNFGEIFYSNCFNNGLLACRVNPTDMQKLFETVREKPQTEFIINLFDSTISTQDTSVPFLISDRHRHMLMQGLDALEMTLSEIDSIQAFRERHEKTFPWMTALAAKAKLALANKGETLFDSDLDNRS